jgi:hypothetical protein
MTKTKINRFGGANDHQWECVIQSVNYRHGEEYAVMFSLTGKKEKRLVVHFSDSVIKLMKWRRGDRLSVLLCRNTNCVAIKRSAGVEPGLTLTGKGGEKSRVQFHFDVAKRIGITDRVLIQADDVSADGELLVISRKGNEE